MNPNEVLAQILTEVKLAERQLAKLQAQSAPMEESIKSALRAGDRPNAEKLALKYEQLKAQIGRIEKNVKDGRAQYDAARVKSKQIQSDVKSARGLNETTKALAGMAGSMEMLKEQDRMVQKLEEEAAMSEARLEVAMDDAGHVDVPPQSPEDILRQMEQDL
jgi:phage shock protein A